jgi:hypothetical protein
MRIRLDPPARGILPQIWGRAPPTNRVIRTAPEAGHTDPVALAGGFARHACVDRALASRLQCSHDASGLGPLP